MGHIIQFTGLSGAGKTTLSTALLEWGAANNISIKLVDGDVYRQTLCKDLGFSKADRLENVARLGAYAASIATSYDFVIIAAINPYEEGRRQLKEQYNAPLIWIQCDLETLISRDTKGLYRRALLPDGHPEKIHNLTGLNDTFDTPASPDLIIDTTRTDTRQALASAVAFLNQLSRQQAPAADIPSPTYTHNGGQG
ncbi:adenylyl-sulfate kinase [Chitinophaga rhizophila]|uniref:Adenylyl-sulfate kinase n=1 Tax=Chitinophaga rhizophila TaxID=2866212 RepID=A0ABS7GD65_9BACT|nr:adenylyl-sulfate kinase [Chitinophaga rhizophila]MBW8684617.1 adenylyl-sulfate kinase [Chitinophaga rhizophila]